MSFTVLLFKFVEFPLLPLVLFGDVFEGILDAKILPLLLFQLASVIINLPL